VPEHIASGDPRIAFLRKGVAPILKRSSSKSFEATSHVFAGDIAQGEQLYTAILPIQTQQTVLKAVCLLLVAKPAIDDIHEKNMGSAGRS